MKNGLRALIAFLMVVAISSGLWAQAAMNTGTAKKAKAANSQGMTKGQADAILDELQQIRRLLEKQPSGDAIATELRLMRQVMERQQAPQQAAAPQPQTPPSPQKAKFVLGDGPSMGAKDAPLVLVEFADYQCTFCRAFHSGAFPELKKNLIDTGKLRFISRDLPLDFHNNAAKAAQAARCAGEQNKFWEMRDVLIRNASNLAPDAVLQYAQGLPLDIDRFKTCATGNKYLAEIGKQAADASALGIGGTPSFLLGKMNGNEVEGVILVGAQSYSFFEAQVQQMLAK